MRSNTVERLKEPVRFGASTTTGKFFYPFLQKEHGLYGDNLFFKIEKFYIRILPRDIFNTRTKNS